jgi:stage II sporulation protein M
MIPNAVYQKDIHIVKQATIGTLYKILTNNLLFACFLLMGFLSFGLTAVFAIIYNGIIIGYAVKYGIAHVGLLQTLTLLLPHGIIEVSAILLACFSIRLSIAFAQLLYSGLENTRFFSLIFSRHTIVLFGMITVAAFIETFVTPYIFEYLIQSRLFSSHH